MSNHFDAFISYQWNVKPTVRCLYDYLTKRGLEIWIDMHEMGTTSLTDEIAKGIKSSKIFICCITLAYSQSDNCRREIEYASTLKKPMVVLMLERLAIEDLAGLGFIINPFVRINCYKFPVIWIKNNFESIYEDVVAKHEGLNIHIKDKNNPCTVDTCHNGGTCFSDNQQNTQCFCPEGFEGANCEKIIDFSLKNTLSGHIGWIASVAFSSDNSILASGSEDWTVRLWNTNTGDLLRTMSGHQGRVNGVAFDKNNLLASCSEDNTIKLWDVNSGDLLRTLTGQHSTHIASIAFNSEGMLASCSWDNAVKIWDVATGSVYRTLTGHTNAVLSVVYSNDNNYLASGSIDSSVKLWNAYTGALIQTMTGHTGSINGLAFNGENILASCSEDRTIRLWDIPSGAFVRTLTGHTNVVSSCVFAGKNVLMSGSWDKSIKFWNVATGELLNTLNGHNDRVFTVAFKGLLASGSNDKTIRLWST